MVARAVGKAEGAPGRREQRKREVRDALYAAATRLIEAQGYEAVSIEQVVQAAGVAKGTFFNHFPSKADLVAEWYSRVIEHTLEDYRPGRARDLAGRLVHLATASNRRGQEAPALWQAKNTLALSSPAIQAAERDGDAAIERFAAKLVREATQAGEIRADVDAGAFAALYTSLVTGVVRQWLVVGRVPSIERLLRERIGALVALAASGVAPGGAKGRK